MFRSLIWTLMSLPPFRFDRADRLPPLTRATPSRLRLRVTSRCRPTLIRTAAIGNGSGARMVQDLVTHADHGDAYREIRAGQGGWHILRVVDSYGTAPRLCRLSRLGRRGGPCGAIAPQLARREGPGLSLA